jgi:MraZ protein
MFFAGTYELTVDNKNRLSIPFAIRRKLSEETDGHSFYAVPGRRQSTLALYAEKYFERMHRDAPVDDALSDEAYAYRQFEYSQSALLEPDGQGRVLIPERLLDRAGLGKDKDVVLIAVRDHLELWNRSDFEAFERGMWPVYPQQRAKAVEEAKRLTSGPGPGEQEIGR